MGTYTTNYNLFMPTIGEQGWGELVNNNFSTIDTTMKSLNNGIGTLETDMDAVEERVTTLEAGNFETVHGEYLYGNLCGNRIGVATTVQPSAWATVVIGNSVSFSGTGVNGSGNSTFSGSKTWDTTEYKYWDVIENTNGDYTIKFNPAVSSSGTVLGWVTEATIVFLDKITNEEITKSYSGLTINGATYTVNIPLLADIKSINGTMYSRYNTLGMVANMVVITRNNDVYIKPKGT